MNSLKDQIKAEALKLGFSHCGIARNDSLENIRPFYENFLRSKGQAGLDYLEKWREERLHPELVLEGTRSVIALLLNYFPPEPIPEQDNLIISKYAYGADYHKVMRKRLSILEKFIKSTGQNVQGKAFSDSGKVMEKAWAQRCGVGWQGKNTLIINKHEGSFFFIGIVLTTLDLEPDNPETDHCGSCNKCVEACPTGALHPPYRLNIPRCISYHTIETREEIPSEIRQRLNNRIYGCDICQDACPYNRFAAPHRMSELLPSPLLKKIRKREWSALTEPGFNVMFGVSSVKRTGYRKLMNNIRAALPSDRNQDQALPG